MGHGAILSGPARAVILAGLVLVGLLILLETWRRSRYPEALTPEQFRRRLAGGLILEVDLLLWLLSDVLTRHWRPAAQLLYLFGALLLVFVPMYLAIREAGFVARQYARSRTDLARNLGRRSHLHDNGRDGSA